MRGVSARALSYLMKLYWWIGSWPVRKLRISKTYDYCFGISNLCSRWYTYNLKLSPPVVGPPDRSVLPEHGDEWHVLAELLGVQQYATVEHDRLVRGQLGGWILPWYI